MLRADRNKKLTAAERGYLLSLYHSGKTYTEIAQIMQINVSIVSVQNIVKVFFYCFIDLWFFDL